MKEETFWFIHFVEYEWEELKDRYLLRKVPLCNVN